MPKTANHPHACPGDESVVAYVTAGLTDAERGDIEAHLRSCDRCVATVAMVSQRVRLGDEIPAAVPRSVRDRVSASIPLVAPAPDGPPASRGSDWLSIVREWASAWLRPPVLIPTALAVGALLFVVTQSPTAPADRSRSLPSAPATLRVTGHAVPVYEQPSSRSATCAKVEHGTQVIVRGEERDWYSVVLPDGTSGWVEREAFE